MGYSQANMRAARLGEFTIGAADIDAAAKGVALTGAGGVITGLQVIAGGPGDLYYVDANTGATCHLTGLGTAAGDVEPTAAPLAIKTICGTANGSTPSAGLTLRAVWS